MNFQEEFKMIKLVRKKMKPTCPKCHSKKHVICLAGGTLLTLLEQTPLYCLVCKKLFNIPNTSSFYNRIKSPRESRALEFGIIEKIELSPNFN